MSKKVCSASHSFSKATSGDLADWSRRDFLKRSGSVLAGMTLASKSVMAAFLVRPPEREEYNQTQWWQTDMLPEPLRYNSGHGGSHNFLTHEFIDALTHDRRPAIDVYESLAYTVPGIVAHESAMQGGTLKKIPQFDRPEKT